jgi:hypothetical protein
MGNRCRRGNFSIESTSLRWSECGSPREAAVSGTHWHLKLKGIVFRELTEEVCEAHLFADLGMYARLRFERGMGACVGDPARRNVGF